MHNNSWCCLPQYICEASGYYTNITVPFQHIRKLSEGISLCFGFNSSVSEMVSILYQFNLIFWTKICYLLEGHEKDISDALVSFWQTSVFKVIQNHQLKILLEKYFAFIKPPSPSSVGLQEQLTSASAVVNFADLKFLLKTYLVT